MFSTTKSIGKGVVRRWGSACALCAVLALPALAQNEDENTGVNVTAHDTVDITVQDTDLAQVLQMLSIQSQKNIIVSKSVSGTVTANLYNVTFYEALENILRVNGYGYYEQGNFIYVHTLEELEQMEDAQRTRESRIFDLDYLAAADAYEFVVPMLSEVGAASYRGEVPAGMRPDVSDGGADSYAYTSKLVVSDYPENLDRIGELLEELDTPPQQVLVESTILQTALDESNAFGVDFNVVGSVDFLDLTNPLSVVNNLLAGDDPAEGFQPDDNSAYGVQATPGNTSGPGTFKVGIVSDDVSVFLKLLDEVTDSVVLARPKVMALNRQRAEVLVGARVGYLSTTATETTTTQTVEFLDTGIQLIFRPFISKNGMIRMELSPSVSEASLRTVTDAQGQLVTIPDELTNELTTNVRVRDGETLVLGGLFRESTRTTRRQVPGLGDIPVLGAAFRGHDDTLERDEIIFLITPSVIEDQRLWDAGDEMLGYMDEVRVGAREGLLPFSREKQALMHNLRAQDAFDQGDTEKALYHVNNSLRLYPQQPEIIRLREQITGQKVKDHERNLQERVLRKVLGPMDERHMVGAPAPVDPTFDPASTTSNAGGGNPYGNDPFELDTDFTDENWDVDSSQPEGMDDSNTSSTTSSISGYKWDNANEPFPPADGTTSNVDNAAGQGAQPSETDSFGETSEFDSTGTNDSTSEPFGSQSSETNQNDSFGASASGTDESTTGVQPLLSERQRMSMEFLNSLYIALGLPPLTETTNLTQQTTTENAQDSSTGEFPFETFDDASGVAEAEEDNPY